MSISNKLEIPFEREVYFKVKIDGKKTNENVLGRITRGLTEGVRTTYKASTKDKKLAGSMEIETQKGKNRIWVDIVSNDQRETLGEVGTELLNSAILESLAQGCEGNVALEAVDDSHLFYIKYGCIEIKPKKDILGNIAKKDTAVLKGIFTSTNEEIEQEIAKNPNGKTAMAIETAKEELATVWARQNNKELEDPAVEERAKTISVDYIRKNWYWDLNFPTMDDNSLEKEIELAKKEKREPNTSRIGRRIMIVPKQKIDAVREKCLSKTLAAA